MILNKGDTVSINGFVGEIISLDGNLVEVLFGGSALHYCIETYNIEDLELLSRCEEYLDEN